MANNVKYPAPVRLEPLLNAIAEVAKELGDARAPLRDAVQALTKLAGEKYFPLCMRAHVFHDPDDEK